MRAPHIVLAVAILGGGMLAAADAQDGRPFAALRAAVNSLTARVTSVEQQSKAIPKLDATLGALSASVSALESKTIPALGARVASLEQQAQAIPGPRIVDANAQVIGRALFGGNTYAMTTIDGVAVAFQVADGGFRQTPSTSFWYETNNCTGAAFLTTDTGVIRQAQVVGTSAIYAFGQFRPVTLLSRKPYPTGTCSTLSSTTTAAELAIVDVSGYRTPFSLIE